MTDEWAKDMRIMIVVAEAGWRGSPCWHVFDWICWQLRFKYPLVMKRDRVIDFDAPIT